VYKIDAQPEGVARARRIIAEELSVLLSPRDLDEVKLMVSEIVTNGIVHARQERGVPVMLDLYVNGDIRSAVLDHGLGFAARDAEGHAPRLGFAARRAAVGPVGNGVFAPARRSGVRTQLGMRSCRVG
jgi:anti-sigma regulatory factor (Ser/Thr protein kinase)